MPLCLAPSVDGANNAMSYSPRDPLPRTALTMLAVLTVFSELVLIILVPVRPSRDNAISMPSVRSCRRSERTEDDYQSSRPVIVMALFKRREAGGPAGYPDAA
jgi:hypothetical protein